MDRKVLTWRRNFARHFLGDFQKWDVQHHGWGYTPRKKWGLWDQTLQVSLSGKNIEMSTIMWGKSENHPFYGAQVWCLNNFNTPRNGQLGHFGDGLSVRLAIGWNDGVQIQGNLSPRYPSQRILPPSFKLFFCSGKGFAQKCSIPRNWIFTEKLLKKHWVYMDFI